MLVSGRSRWPGVLPWNKDDRCSSTFSTFKLDTIPVSNLLRDILDSIYVREDVVVVCAVWEYKDEK